MRKPGLVLLLLLLFGGVIGLLARTVLRDEEPRGRVKGAAPPAAPEEPEKRTPTGLVVRDGVAHAPDFENVGPAAAGRAPEGGHLFVGRAVSGPSRAPVAGAAVVLETVDGTHAWAQAATDDAGRFRAAAPAHATGDLRVVLRSHADEVGVVAARRGEGDVTDLGVVVLRGSGELEGRTLELSDTPVAGVSLDAHVLDGPTVRPHPVARARSDEHGNFKLEPLPRGLFVVRGRDAAGRTYLAVPVAVPADAPLVLRPLPDTPLALVLRNTAGEAVPRALVEVIPREIAVEADPLQRARFLRPYAATTDKAGRAEIPHLPAGPYWIYISLENGAPFEFEHEQAGPATRALTVATEPAYVFRFVRVPPPLPAAPPIVNRRIRIIATGDSSVPGRRRTLTFAILTDDDGRATLPRLGSLGISFQSQTVGDDDKLVGSGRVDSQQYPEGWLAVPAPMHPPLPDEEPPPPAPPAKAPERPRRVRVHSAGGLPVKGARVYATGGKMATTNAAGIADLGAARDDARAHLHRPDLASGDPASPEFGQLEVVDLTWNEGRLVTVRVIDAEDGYRLDRGVRLGPRHGAWERIEPGVFRTRWDPAYADPEAKLAALAEGYEPWEGAPPDTPGEPVTHEAALEPALDPTGVTLLLEVRRDNAPAAAAVVYGRTAVKSATMEFTTLTDHDGVARVTGLPEGTWSLDAHDRTGRRGYAQLRLVRGVNPIPIELTGRPPGFVTCVDDRGTPLAGVRIERIDARSREPVEFSDANGRYFLADRAAHLRATKSGYAAAEVTLPAKRPARNSRIVLPRLASIDLPVQWRDGSGPVPDDIRMRITHFSLEQGRSRRRTQRTVLRTVAHVENGRLRADDLPPGRVRFDAVDGTAWALPFYAALRPGEVARSPAVSLTAGGTIEGLLIRDRKPVPHGIVYVSRGSVLRALRANKDGEYRGTGFAPGTYLLSHPHQTRDSARQTSRVRVDEIRVTKTVVELR